MIGCIFPVEFCTVRIVLIDVLISTRCYVLVFLQACNLHFNRSLVFGGWFVVDHCCDARLVWFDQV